MNLRITFSGFSAPHDAGSDIGENVAVGVSTEDSGNSGSTSCMTTNSTFDSLINAGSVDTLAYAGAFRQSLFSYLAYRTG